MPSGASPYLIGDVGAGATVLQGEHLSVGFTAEQVRALIEAATKGADKRVAEASRWLGVTQGAMRTMLDPVLERAYTLLFDQFAHLPMPDPVYVQAARLRAHFGLRTPDALHLACAQHHGCQALWTNDGRLAQASHGLARDILR